MMSGTSLFPSVISSHSSVCPSCQLFTTTAQQLIQKLQAYHTTYKQHRQGNVVQQGRVNDVSNVIAVSVVLQEDASRTKVLPVSRNGIDTVNENAGNSPSPVAAEAAPVAPAMANAGAGVTNGSSDGAASTMQYMIEVLSTLNELRQQICSSSPSELLVSIALDVKDMWSFVAFRGGRRSENSECIDSKGVDECQKMYKRRRSIFSGMQTQQ